jgi:hypothetical protein
MAGPQTGPGATGLCGKATPPAAVRGKLLPLERDLHQEEISMSPLAIASSATTALSSVNIHPHGHGHKKGLQLDSAADSSGAAGQASSNLNIFSSLFESQAQVIGARPAQTAQAAQVTKATHPAQSAQAAQLAIGSRINTTA